MDDDTISIEMAERLCDESEGDFGRTSPSEGGLGLQGIRLRDGWSGTAARREECRNKEEREDVGKNLGQMMKVLHNN